jgi:probable HAF family extracellular repeat protein
MDAATRLVTALCAALITGLTIGTAPAVARQGGELVDLGVEQCARDITNRGVILLEEGIYRRGALEPLPGDLVHAWRMNESGRIAGATTDGAAVWDGRRTLEIGLPRPGDTYAHLTGINNRGAVVGTAGGDDPDEPTVAFLWTVRHGFRILSEDGVRAGANAVNDRGQVVGYVWDRDRQQAVRWDADGTMVRLGRLGGGGGHSLASAINRHGQAVGYSYGADGAMHPVRWTSSGRVTSLSPGGSVHATATDINARGHVVGDHSPAGKSQRGFLHTPRTSLRSAAPLAAGTTGTLSAINDRGQAVGCEFAGDTVTATFWPRGR